MKRMEESRSIVFISHIGEERAVALRLQGLIKSVFADAFPVFVSSDPGSLGGGEEWYHYILQSLGSAKVVLVLLSPESIDRAWINFEAGFAKGQGSRVIPVAFRGLSFDMLDYPLKGLQGYYLVALKEILNEISICMGIPLAAQIDLMAAGQEINNIQLDLPVKKLALDLEETLDYPVWHCFFHLKNEGNRDVEPLEVTVLVPTAILVHSWNQNLSGEFLRTGEELINYIHHTQITYTNDSRGGLINDRRMFSPEPLVACLAPGMTSRVSPLHFDIRYPLEEHELENPLRYRIIARNVKKVEGTITLKDKLMAPPSTRSRRIPPE
jgi:hypothetical protein